MKSIVPPTEDEVRQRAHQIWEEAGRPDGQDNEHWLRAERELREGRDQPRTETTAAAANNTGKSPRNRTARVSTPAARPGLAAAATTA